MNRNHPKSDLTGFLFKQDIDYLNYKANVTNSGRSSSAFNGKSLVTCLRLSTAVHFYFYFCCIFSSNDVLFHPTDSAPQSHNDHLLLQHNSNLTLPNPHPIFTDREMTHRVRRNRGELAQTSRIGCETLYRPAEQRTYSVKSDPN